jgi:MFS family permease
LNRNLILVALSLMIWGIGEGMFLLFQPLYLQQMGADPILIGAIIGLTGTAMTLAHLPAGYLADRFGRRPILVAAWYLATFATGVMALANSLTLFVIGSILYSISAFVSGPMNSYITAARGKLSVARALTLVSAIYNLGAIAGPLLGGWIGNQWGLRRNFLVAAGVFILSSMLITLIRPQPVEKFLPEAKSSRKSVLLNPRFLGYLALTFLIMFVLYLPQPLTVNFLQNERALDLTQIGTLISLRSVGVIILNLGLGQLNPRLGFLLSQLALGIFCAIIWKGASFPWYSLAYLLLGGYQTARSMAAAQGRALVNAAYMGMAYGMIETVSAVSVILAPPLAGYLYAWKPDSIYVVSLACIGGVILLALLFLPRQVHLDETHENTIQVESQ